MTERQLPVGYRGLWRAPGQMPEPVCAKDLEVVLGLPGTAAKFEGLRSKLRVQRDVGFRPSFRGLTRGGHRVIFKVS